MKFSQILNQDRVTKLLTGAIRNDRMSNAYLFLGYDPEALRAMSLAFAAALNCTDKNGGDACGTCASCVKISKAIDPDVITIVPDGAGIKIEQIRDLIPYTRSGPLESRYKVCIISGADKMTDPAANSFLKTLEEPAANIVFILLASNDVGIPKTVISRCQKILFSEISDVVCETDADVEEIYSKLLGLSPRTIPEALNMAEGLYNQKDDLDGTLESLLCRLANDGGITSQWRKFSIVLSALSSIKKRANQRLALDVMCLKIGESNVN